MNWLIKLPVAILFLVSAFVSALAAGTVFRPLLQAGVTHWPWWLAGGVGLAAGLWRGFSGFYRTLEHELTHVIFALLFLQPPRHLVVTHERGGEAGYAGSGNFIISLAPYFFPLTAVVISGVTALAADSLRGRLVLLVITALGYHLTVVLGELRVGQTDLSRHRTWFSATVIAGIGLPVLTVLLAFAVGGGSTVTDYGRAWLESARGAAGWVTTLRR